MTIGVVVGCALVGFFVGTCSRELLHRAPMRERLRYPELHCRNCTEPIRGSRRFALIALARKKHRCTRCSEEIVAPNLWLELALAGVGAGVGVVVGPTWPLGAYLVFFLGLALMSVIDLRHYIIPNRILYPTLIGTMGLLGVAAIAMGTPSRFAMAVIGMAVAFLFFFLTSVIYPAGMGFGDVRLAALIGLGAGWLSLTHVFLAVMTGLLLASMIGVGLIAFRRRGRKEAIPFGPFLAVGATVAIVWGSDILSWWLG